MTLFKLVYFDFKGRGELARLIFAASKQNYEDKRLEYSDACTETLAYKQEKAPFGRLPVLEIIEENGQVKRLAQSIAIGRYLANKFGLAGKSEWEKAEADCIVDQISDFSIKVVEYIIEKDEKKLDELSKNLHATVFPNHFKYLELKIKENKNGFLVGDNLTWTDLHLINILDWFDDGIKEKIFDKYSTIKEHNQRVKSLPEIEQWLVKRPVTIY